MYLFRRIKKEDHKLLFDLFVKNKDNKFFDPFPLDESSVNEITTDFKNLYYGIFSEGMMIGFGMLRWYKRFKSPTLGLLIDSAYRGKNLGIMMYAFLLAQAKERKYKEVFAIVHKDNLASMHIAKMLGMIELEKLAFKNRYDFTKYDCKDKVILIKSNEK